MRNEQLSIFKAIGIIFMVVGHSGCPELLYNFIYLFHMPLFYFGSGYFFKAKYKDEKLGFIKRKIKGLYFPYVKYGLIFLLLHNVFYFLNIYNDQYGFHGGVSKVYSLSDFTFLALKLVKFGRLERLVSGYWFLSSLFMVNILFLFLYSISSKFSPSKALRLSGFMGLLLFFIGYFMHQNQVVLPQNLTREMIMLPLFWLGAYAGSRKIPVNRYAVVLSFLVLVVCGHFGTLNLSISAIVNPYFFAIVSLCGCYMVFGISKAMLKSPTLSHALLYTGDKTMIILTFHFLSMKLVSLLIIAIYGLEIAHLAEFPVIESAKGLWWMVYTVVGVTVPMLAACASKRGFTYVRTKITRV
ncbi:MAG: acyltransferase family protein [Bacteroidaceae bacterium]